MLETLLQLPLGFFVALSGALIPGPLLAYVTTKSMEGGWKVGPLAVLGHLVVEVAVILLLLVGIGYVLAHPPLGAVIELTGGCLLVLLAVLSIRGLRAGKQTVVATSFHPFIGGILFSSILNPTVPLWWVGVGFALLLQAYSAASFAGVAAWLVGHYAADFGWFSLVSSLVNTNRIKLEKVRIWLLRVCVGILLVLGGFLLARGVVGAVN